MVREFARKGLPVVLVNPAAPIGTHDIKPTPTGKMIVDFLNGKMPAYVDTGMNFIDVEDVAAGHWLAAEKGKVGERYLLGNKNMTLEKFSWVRSLGFRDVARAAYSNSICGGIFMAGAVSTGTVRASPAKNPRSRSTACAWLTRRCTTTRRKPGERAGPSTVFRSMKRLKKAVLWFRDTQGYLSSRGKTGGLVIAHALGGIRFNSSF